MRKISHFTHIMGLIPLVPQDSDVRVTHGRAGGAINNVKIPAEVTQSGSIMASTSAHKNHWQKM